MTRKWSARLLAISTLMLAIGCRSTPGTPVVTTPLLPEAVVVDPYPVASGPALPATPMAMPRTMVASPGKPTILPPGAQLPRKGELEAPTLPSPRLAATPVLPSPEVPAIVPPKDITPTLTSNPKPVIVPKDNEPLPAPTIKPLLVEAPRPPAGPDGFAPAPIIPPPTLKETLPPPKVTSGQGAPELPLKAGERFGRASDFKWIAGVLDRHSKGGYWTLRYADFGNDDEWGGKVRLLDDERLSAFSNGDVIFIEGDLLAPRIAASVEGSNYPPFRISGVRLIEKAK